MSITSRILSTCLVVLAPSLLPVSAGQPIKVASWNLGWHVSQVELPQWINQCSKHYEKDPVDKVWKEVATGGTVGWFIKEYRAQIAGVDLSIMPPCGVYADQGRNNLAVTGPAYIRRSQQIASLIAGAVEPDVIAFQEVSGTQAVSEALGPKAVEYNICSFDGKYKVQRLAFAWKKQLGEAEEACSVIDAVSLPNLSIEQQVRPALQMGLRINGKLMRFLTVHLKSGCVSALEGGKLDQDSGKDDPCPILQQQVRPLEDAFEHLGVGADYFVVLGDFNRNLWHEFNELPGSKSVRSDGTTDLSKPWSTNVLTQNLFKEINDGDPAASKATLLELACPGSPSAQVLCSRAKVEALKPKDLAPLAAAEALGCRNPVGLDHFIVSDTLKPMVQQVRKVSIGKLGQSLAPSAARPDPLLAVSDHCPILMTVEL
jgi:endonuclease/exonuclease/phosphatase family metal-dependent hydrolase